MYRGPIPAASNGIEPCCRAAASRGNERTYAALLPPQPRGGKVGALAQRLELRARPPARSPIRGREGAEAAIGRGDDALAVADRRDRLLDAPRHHFRMLDEIAGRSRSRRGSGSCPAGTDALAAPRIRARGADWRTRSTARRPWPDRAPAASLRARCRRCAGLPSCPSRRAAARGRRGMPSMPLLIAATCSSHALTKSASVPSDGIMVRSIARSGASICRISPALWIA